jgi:HPt (histidine-containing phosphotransfer) domain-containing protein
MAFPANLGAIEQASYPQMEEVRALDLVRLARHSQGNAELERELLALFDRQATQIMGQLRTSSGRALQKDLAHMLAASARAVGAEGVEKAARAFEELAQTPVTAPVLEKALTDLEAAVRAATSAIKALLA